VANTSGHFFIHYYVKYIYKSTANKLNHHSTYDGTLLYASLLPSGGCSRKDIGKIVILGIYYFNQQDSSGTYAD